MWGSIILNISSGISIILYTRKTGYMTYGKVLYKNDKMQNLFYYYLGYSQFYIRTDFRNKKKHLCSFPSK